MEADHDEHGSAGGPIRSTNQRRMADPLRGEGCGGDDHQREHQGDDEQVLPDPGDRLIHGGQRGVSPRLTSGLGIRLRRIWKARMTVYIGRPRVSVSAPKRSRILTLVRRHSR